MTLLRSTILPLVPLSLSLATACARPSPPPGAAAVPGASAQPSAAAPAACPKSGAERLPRVTEAHARLVHHHTPRVFWRDQRELQTSRTLEFEIRTTHDLASLFALDVAPQLFVGGVPINDEGILVAPCVARFTTAVPESVTRGAEIAFDFPYSHPPRPTGLRYEGYTETTR